MTGMLEEIVVDSTLVEDLLSLDEKTMYVQGTKKCGLVW
jgi:hypothetical protein